MSLRSALLLAAASLALPCAAAAQRLPIEVGASVGIVTPDGEYSTECSEVNPVVALQGRSRGATYVSGLITAYREGVGTDVGCETGGPGLGVYVHRSGGLSLENALRLGMGVGRRTAMGGFSLEVEGTAGVTRGRPGYRMPGAAGPDEHRWIPWIGFGLGATVARHLTIAWEQDWTRLPFRTEIHPWTPTQEDPDPPPPGTGDFELQEGSRWAPMDEVRIGIRL